MGDEFVLSVGQAHELEHAFRRNGWNASDVKVLSIGKNLTQVREFILGRAEIKPQETIPEPPPLFLEPVGTITIPALAGRFSAREKFVLNYGRKAKWGVRIAYLGGDFQNRFGNTVEELTAEAVVSYVQLMYEGFHDSILASLGNRSDLAVFLRQIYWLMGEQPNGESGTLLADGQKNIFYTLGLIRAVAVSWGACDGGWKVRTCLATDWHDRPDRGDQVFSRNPA